MGIIICILNRLSTMKRMHWRFNQKTDLLPELNSNGGQQKVGNWNKNSYDNEACPEN
jgi:hypothetical protein